MYTCNQQLKEMHSCRLRWGRSSRDYTYFTELCLEEDLVSTMHVDAKGDEVKYVELEDCVQRIHRYLGALLVWIDEPTIQLGFAGR